MTHILSHKYLLLSHYLPTCVTENRFHFYVDEGKLTLPAYSTEHMLNNSLCINDEPRMHFLYMTSIGSTYFPRLVIHIVQAWEHLAKEVRFSPTSSI